MAERHEPESIEIELTSDVPMTRSSRTGRAAPVDDSSSSSELRGRVAIAATVGVAALVLGVLIGRAVGDDAVAGDADAENESVLGDDDTLMTTVTTSSLPGLETLPAPRPAPTTTVLRTTTTTLAVQESQIEIGAPLAGRAIEIVGTSTNAVIRIDARTGTMRTIAARVNPNGSIEIVAGEGWVAQPSWDFAQPMRVVFDDGTTAEIETPPGSNVFVPDDGATLWTQEQHGGLGGTVLIERTPSGEPTGAVVETPGYVTGLDPLGGVVVHAAGGAYRLDGDVVEQLTSGDLLAIGRTTLFVEECDAQLNCQHAVVDRASGTRRPIDLAASFDDSMSLAVGVGWFGTQSMSPTGDAILAVVFSSDPFQSEQHTGLLDLVTGDFTELDLDPWGSPLVWSPDGELIIFNGPEGITVYDRTDGSTTVVIDRNELPLTGMTIRFLEPAG